MKKADSIPSDGTKADSEQKVEHIFHIAKPPVSGCFYTPIKTL
jgi:hypothetical protein